MKRAVVAALLVSVTGCQRGRSTKLDPPRPPQVEHVQVDAGQRLAQPLATHPAAADSGVVLAPVQQAMARLVKAMVSNDPAGVLACISKRKPTWLISSGVDGKTRKMKFSYPVIEKGMKPDGDFWYYFFDDDSELVRGVDGEKPWHHAAGDKFVAPVYANDPDNATAGIRWRKEGDAYVIDAIFDSGS